MSTELNNTYLAAGGTLSLGFGTSATKVYGSTAADTVTIATGVTVVLDGSFNRGNDTIKFTGNADSYSIVRVNASTIKITDASGTSVTIPVGSAGTQLQFADATRTLSGSSAGILLGNQSVSATPVALAAGTAPTPVESYILTTSTPTVVEGNNGTKTLTYVLELNKAPTSEVSVNYRTTDAGTAAAGDDFQVVAGLVTFAAGQTAATVSVTVFADTTVEADETVVLQLSGSKLVSPVTATGTIRNDDDAPVDPSSYTVSAGDIAAANAANTAIALNVGDTGNKTVTIQSDGASATAGIIINGNANAAITSGAAADKITVTGNGNNTITAGAGNDNISVFGTGTNTINVGTGSDVVNGGTGNDTIVFAAGALGAGDVVDGGAGVDTIRVSGDGNIIGAGGATLSNIENIVFDGTEVSISATALAALIEGGLKTISGSSSTTELTITGASGTLDLSKVAIIGGLEKLITAGTGNLVLNTTQVAQIQSVTGPLTTQVIVTGDQTVASAAALIASGVTAKFALVDTAANLALAPSAVFAKAVSVQALGDATAAQAVQIAGVIAGSANSSIFANSVVVDAAVKVSVTDTASMLANNVSGLAIADKVTATTAATVAEANAIVTANTGGTLFTASYAVADSAANLAVRSVSVSTAASTTITLTAGSTSGFVVGERVVIAGAGVSGADLDTVIATVPSGTTFTVATAATSSNTHTARVNGLVESANVVVLNGATSVTVTGTPSVAQIAAINSALTDTAGGLTKVAAGYSLADTAATLKASGNAAITAAAANVDVVTAAGRTTVASISVADATAVDLLLNTGANTYQLSDTAALLRSASPALTAVATNALTGGVAATSSGTTITVADMNALVAKFGGAAFSTTLTVTDSAAELVKLSAAVLNEIGGSVRVVFDPNTTATVAELTALNAFFSGTKAGNAPTASSVKVKDTAANLDAAVKVSTTLTALDASHSVTVSDAATVAQISAINAKLLGVSSGLTTVVAGYALSDTAAKLSVTNDSNVTRDVIDNSAKVTVSGTATVAQMNTIAASFGRNGDAAVLGTDLVYAVRGTAASMLPTLSMTTTASSVTVTAVTTDLAVGMTVIGAGIPAGATIATVGVSTFTLSVAATAGATITATVVPTPVLSAATSVSITDTVVTPADAINLRAQAKFDGVYAIEGNVDELDAAYGTTQSPNVAGRAALTGATSVTLVDSLSALFNAGVPVDAQALARTVIASGDLATLKAGNAIDKASVDGFRITDSGGVSITGSGVVADVNALSAIAPTQYTIAATTYANLMGTAAGVANFVGKAAGLTVTDTDLTVAKYNALDARAEGKISYEANNAKLVDSASNLASGSAATAVAGTPVAKIVVDTDLTKENATVAEAAILVARGITGFTISDTAANISAASATLLADSKAGFILNSDGGELTLSVASALKVLDRNTSSANASNPDGSASATYNLVDTAANLAAADADLIGFAKSVTATTAATATEANTLAGRTSMGTITYDVSATAADLISSGAATAGANKARNVTVLSTGSASVAQAVILQDATNTGTLSYKISDIATELALENTAANAKKIAAIEAATGTVVVNNGSDAIVTAAEATLIAAYTKPVTYDVVSTYAALTDADVSVSATSEARDITITDDSLTAARAAAVLALANTGKVVFGNASGDTITGAATDLLALQFGANDRVSTLKATGNTSASDAAALIAKEAGINSGAGTLVIDKISDTASALAAAKSTTLAAGTAVTATTAATLAEATLIYAGKATATFDLIDTYANLMKNSDAVTDVTNAAADVDRAAVITQARKVTVSDALTVAQVTRIVDEAGGSDVALFTLADVYHIVDADQNIAAAMISNATVLSKAASVTLANGTAVKFDAIGSDLVIVGTRAEIGALPTTLATSKKLVEASVADLATDPAYFTSLASNVSYRVVDTFANLTSNNALVNVAAGLTVTDVLDMAKAGVVRALGVATGEINYSLSDTTAKLLVGSSSTSSLSPALDGAINISATTAATVGEAAILRAAAANGAGKATYSISEADTATTLVSGNAAILDGATNITITATTSGSITATEADVVMMATNSGATTIALVSGSASSIAAIVTSKGANDTITKIEATSTSSVADIKVLQGMSNTVVYALSDTAANLAAAGDAVLNGATSIAATGTATLAQLAIIDAATPSNANTTVTVKDTAANILAASPSLLARANGAITLTDKSLSAATIAQLEALDDAYTTFSITTSTTPIVDTSANLLLAENAAVVAAADHVTVSDTMAVAKALLVADVVGAVGSGQSFVYNLSDTYAALALAAPTADGAANVTVTNLVSASQAKNADDWAGKATYSVRDTAAQLANSTYAAAIAKATAVTATTAADITQAGKLSEMANLASYTIKDDATDVFNALNTLNGSGTADRATVLKAASIELTDEANLAEAVGVGATAGNGEKLGLGSISGLSFKVLAGGTELAAALKVPAQAAILANATSVELNSTAGVSVADLTLLADVLGEAFKYDLVTSGAPATTTSEYYIEDTFSNVLVADTAFIEGATTLVVNGTSSAETINMSGFNLGMTINGGLGKDTVTGGAGVDVYAVSSNRGTSPSSDSAVATFDVIKNFGKTTASWTGSSANDTASEFQTTAVGGAAADVLDINLTNNGSAASLTIEAAAANVATTVAAAGAAGAGATGTVTASVANGILSIASTTATDFDTLAEMAAAAALVAATDGETLGFEFSGSTYVFTQNGAADVLVQLEGVVSVAGLTLLANSGTLGGTGYVVIG
jgi:hypothetical protein